MWVTIDNHIVGRFRECLPVRHWVGHGRYWDKPHAVDRFDPDDIYDRANAQLRAMPPSNNDLWSLAMDQVVAQIIKADGWTRPKSDSRDPANWVTIERDRLRSRRV
jgi:hypothetical protein